MLGELSTVAGTRRELRHRRAVPRGDRRRSGLTADTPLLVSPPTDAATSVVRLGGTEPVSVAQIAVVRVDAGSAAAPDLEVASARSSVPEPGPPAPIPPVASGSSRHPLPPRTVGRTVVVVTRPPAQHVGRQQVGSRDTPAAVAWFHFSSYWPQTRDRGRTAQLGVAIQPATDRTEVRFLGVPERKRSPPSRVIERCSWFRVRISASKHLLRLPSPFSLADDSSHTLCAIRASTRVDTWMRAKASA